MTTPGAAAPAAAGSDYPMPTNQLVRALLTDVYQVTMAYAYWKHGRHTDDAVFELFFRKNPFKGEYTIFAGLDECLKYLSHFRFTHDDIEYLRTQVPPLRHCDPAFFDWLEHDCNANDVQVYAMRDGTVAFPRIPLIVVKGPLAVTQLMETTLLTLVNYPSLITTNAARMVTAAAWKTISSDDDAEHPHSRRSSTLIESDKSSSKTSSDAEAEDKPLPAQCYVDPVCIEFGLRRAQGPDGGVSASKYAVMGGFVGTSNVEAGKQFGLTLIGTHAHSFVMSFTCLDDAKDRSVIDLTTGDKKESVLLLPKALQYRKKLAANVNPAYATTNEGELAAFVTYAAAFPHSCLCLIDTYDTLQSGLLNYIIVALALHDCGYKPDGIRLDSGDLAYLSKQCAIVFDQVIVRHYHRPFGKELSIVASNDINETVLYALNEQDHALTSYGIGTNLVTCQAQPALGCVYKLVSINKQPRMKLSQDIAKVLIPGTKKPYRIYGKDKSPLLDLMVGEDDKQPAVGERILCRHPFVAGKRVYVTPSRVEPLHHLVFDQGKVVEGANRPLTEARAAVIDQLRTLRSDILRPVNPAPYKISVSDPLYQFLHDLWQKETPVAELS